MRYNQDLIQNDLSSLRRPVEQWAKKLDASATNLRRVLMVGGGLLTLAGVLAVSTGLVMNLAPGAADELLAELGRLETKIAALHASRSELWNKLKAVLGPAQAEELGEFWYYQL